MIERMSQAVFLYNRDDLSSIYSGATMPMMCQIIETIEGPFTVVDWCRCRKSLKNNRVSIRTERVNDNILETFVFASGNPDRNSTLGVFSFVLIYSQPGCGTITETGVLSSYVLSATGVYASLNGARVTVAFDNTTPGFPRTITIQQHDC